MSTKTLAKIVAPPKSPVEAPSEAQWKKLEKELGTKLPSDYKALVAAYGTGKFDDFIWLANPFSTLMPWRPWFDGTLQALRSTRDTGGEKAVPHAIFPEKDGLLPWASTENGNVFYFRTSGKPDAWPVVVFEARGPRSDELPGGATDALGAVLSKKHRSPVLPEWFPKKPKHAFSVLVDELKTSVALALDETRTFEDRLAIVKKQMPKAKVGHVYSGEATVMIPGTSIGITYRDCDEEDDGRVGAELFAVYASKEEAEVRRIVRDAVAEASWELEGIIDFHTKKPRWDEGP